jgi:hypothetical protein
LDSEVFSASMSTTVATDSFLVDLLGLMFRLCSENNILSLVLIHFTSELSIS